MANKTKKEREQGPGFESTPSFPETKPPLTPSADYTWVLETVMTMHNSMGQLAEAVNGLKESRGEQNQKLDKISDDIHTIKAKIYAAVAVFVIAGSVIGAILGMFGKPIVELILHREPQAVTPATQPPTQAPAPAPSKTR